MINNKKIIEMCRSLINEMYGDYMHTLKYGTLKYYVRDEQLMDNLLIDSDLRKEILYEKPFFSEEVLKAKKVIKHEVVNIYRDFISKNLCLDDLLISINSIFYDSLLDIDKIIDSIFSYSVIQKHPLKMNDIFKTANELINGIDKIISNKYYPNITSSIQSVVDRIEKPFIDEVNNYLNHKTFEGLNIPEITTSFHEYIVHMTHKNTAYIPPLPIKPSI